MYYLEGQDVTFEEVLGIYTGSNGDATRALYDRLALYGPRGDVALNAFRACKASERAKVYRGGGYRGKAYERKDWSIGNLCDALKKHGGRLEILWGWGLDPKAIGFENVLYIDLPTGQISFHNSRRFEGCPNYPRDWDQAKSQAPTRICRWIATILERDPS